MNRLQEKHPLAIRWLHWISFPLLFLMVWSGLMIYWANDIYRVGLGNTTLIHFFPDWLYKLLGVQQRLAWGMAVHFFFMWFFAVNGFLYVTYLWMSGEWRILLPDRHSFRDAIPLCANINETSCVTAISEQGGKETQHGNDERQYSPGVT